MSSCPICGSINRPDARFCNNCGFDFRRVGSVTNVTINMPSPVMKEDPLASKIHLEIVDIMRVLDDTKRFNAHFMYPYIEKLCELKLQGSSEASRSLEKYIDHEYGIIRRKARDCLGTHV